MYAFRRCLRTTSANVSCHDDARRRGTAFVETALVVPILLMVLLGIVEFSRAFMVAQLLTNAAREGCRQAVLQGTSTADVETLIADLVATTVGVSASEVAVTVEISPAEGNPDPENELSQANKRDLCSISVRLPMSAVSFIGLPETQDLSLLGQCAMRHE